MRVQFLPSAQYMSNKKIFKSRKEAVGHFSSIEEGVAEFVDENGEYKKLLKSQDDSSVLTYMIGLFAKSEMSGIQTTIDELDAYVKLAQKFGYDYTPADIRTKISIAKKLL